MSTIREQPGHLKAATIVMVDDEPTTTDVLAMFLEGEGYTQVFATNDSRRAMDLIEEKDPDVVLLDLMMPNVSGLELLTRIRSQETFQFTPVIILTSSLDAETKLKALDLGATDFLGKPVDPSELALRLRNTLAAKAYQDRLTYYDPLTGLPNRQLFVERLDRTLRHARSDGLECAVIQINLDRFKQINDALGRGVGDALLTSLADRLEKCVPPSDLLDGAGPAREGGRVARVGGDEFSLFILGANPVESAARVARRILSALSDPFCVDGRDLFLTSSLGIAVFPDDGNDIDTLLGNATVAMSHAKQSGGNDYQLYSRSLNSRALERLSLETQLRQAVNRDELLLHYQPKVDLGTGRIVGAEALMRWQHPDLGLVPPSRFIPIAEESSLIETLGDWAIEAACSQAKAWQESGLPPIPVSANVTSRQFQPRLMETIWEALRESQLDPKYLMIELTESLIMEDPAQASQILSDLKEMGLRISIDDFGTGYSSLAALKRFPLHELKIDRSFVKGIPRDRDDAAIVTAIIAMAHSLELSVVAEGVETEEQVAFLRERGCNEIQGFLFSRPVAPEDWPAVVRRSQSGNFGRPPTR